jgi:hypothetical protein
MSRCSISGNAYERKIYSILKNTYISGNRFNCQLERDLGGSSANNDLTCVFGNRHIGVEVKKGTSPDWMQCSLFFNIQTGSWEGSVKGKIPPESRKTFNTLLNGVVLFNGKIPPFVNSKITHQEWLNVKNNCTDFKDHYLHIPENTIKNMYTNKDCYYIQISGYGLYHLGTDICNFNVPEFIIKQRLRIRTKVHGKKNKNGFCSLSVTAACQPICIKSLTKSKYSFDDKSLLPESLIWVKN